MKLALITLILAIPFQPAFSQKKPLDPSVYDKWENIAEHIISPDGKYIVYSITPQEGDGRLVVCSTEGDYRQEIPRGTGATITGDSRYLIFHIKPFFKDTREARIKKKTPDQMPKDTLGWMVLGKDSIVRIPRVKSFKTGEKQGTVLAYLLEKPEPPAPGTGPAPDSLTRINRLITRADSLSRIADSLRKSVVDIRSKGFPVTVTNKPKPQPVKEPIEEGTELVIKDLSGSVEKRIPLVSEYYFSRNGKVLIVETTGRNKDSASALKALVLWIHAGSLRIDTVMKGFNDAHNFALDEEGRQLAFVADRDSVSKALVKFYRLWYYTPGMDSAVIRADRNSIPLKSGQLTISPDFANRFSKDGHRLFLGLAPIRPHKDTTLVDFETAKLDVWNFKDDYISPQQLVQLKAELKRSWMAVINEPMTSNHLIQLADDDCETLIPAGVGNGPWALGRSTKGYRIQQQWEQNNLQRLYLVDIRDGSRKIVKDTVRDGGQISPAARFIIWYDWSKRHWFTYEISTGRVQNITQRIRTPLYDEQDDHPDDPPPHGLMGWKENDEYVYIYDRYDIWQCDPRGDTAPVCMTRGTGRLHNLTFRYIPLDREEQFLRQGQLTLLTVFDHKEMGSGIKLYPIGAPFTLDSSIRQTSPFSYNNFIKARDIWTLAYNKGSFDKSNDIYIINHIDTTVASVPPDRQMSRINPQQSSYNWLSVELCHWKMADGRMSEGLLYKPENFDSTKRYPVIFYFYERDAESRYQYMAPQPTRAIINIPYFVSNGYLVFDPNIYYKTGQPGEDAYNSIVSAAKYMSRFKWVDSTKMGLEGHSWGGYQVAYLVTRTHLFAAAEAGAPVVNMTSAYSGIRWSAGISRQFQYERTQSRIGATLWQRPDLYLKNSPLFRADKVTTPLLILHNDADGAVPWYQGIEYFSALRRLGKKVWLIQYNGEDHGLMERSNRKDWSIRLSQFFDYYLKGAPPAKWIRDGVPATLKGIDWGLSTQ